MSSAGWEEPVPAQAASWPILMKNRDLVCIAETGSGKTGAFGIPLALKIKKNHTTQCLIVKVAVV